MRLSSLSLALAAGTTCLYFSSYSSGPASRNNDATSSGLGGSACASCHSGGSFGTATTLALIDETGETVTAYQPDGVYTMRISIATSTAPGGYGFQVLPIDAASQAAGAFGEPPTNTRLSEFNGRTYFEQRRRLGGGVHEIEWVAPAEGTGDVTVYAVGNAVNGNGGTSGDEPNEAIVTLTEEAASAIPALDWPSALRISSARPGTIRLLADGAASQDYSIQLYGIDGRAVASRRVLAQAPLSFTGLAPGVYVVRLSGEKNGGAASRMVPVLR